MNRTLLTGAMLKRGPDGSRLISLTDASRVLGVHRATLYRWLREGRIQRHRRAGDRNTYLRVKDFPQFKVRMELDDFVELIREEAGLATGPIEDRLPDAPTFGEWLAQARRRRRWTQSKLAKQSGISISTLSRFENGKAEPTLSQVAALAGALRRRAWLQVQSAASSAVIRLT